MQETQVQSLGEEDPLEKRMVAHSSFLAWRMPCSGETGRLQFMSGGRGAKSQRQRSTNTQTFIYTEVIVKAFSFYWEDSYLGEEIKDSFFTSILQYFQCFSVFISWGLCKSLFLEKGVLNKLNCILMAYLHAK